MLIDSSSELNPLIKGGTIQMKEVRHRWELSSRFAWSVDTKNRDFYYIHSLKKKRERETFKGLVKWNSLSLTRNKLTSQPCPFRKQECIIGPFSLLNLSPIFSVNYITGKNDWRSFKQKYNTGGWLGGEVNKRQGQEVMFSHRDGGSPRAQVCPELPSL